MNKYTLRCCIEKVNDSADNIERYTCSPKIIKLKDNKNTIESTNLTISNSLQTHNTANL